MTKIRYNRIIADVFLKVNCERDGNRKLMTTHGLFGKNFLSRENSQPEITKKKVPRFIGAKSGAQTSATQKHEPSSLKDFYFANIFIVK